MFFSGVEQKTSVIISIVLFCVREFEIGVDLESMSQFLCIFFSHRREVSGGPRLRRSIDLGEEDIFVSVKALNQRFSRIGIIGCHKNTPDTEL